MIIFQSAYRTISSLFNSANEGTEPPLAQERVEQLPADLLNPNTDTSQCERLDGQRVELSDDSGIDAALGILSPSVELHISEDSEALTRAVESLKNTYDPACVNELLALGLDISSTDLRQLTDAGGIDLARYQLLTDSQGKLITILDKSTEDDPTELVVGEEHGLALCRRASSSPTALACLINHFQIGLRRLIRERFAKENLELSVPFLRHLDLYGVPKQKQAELVFKANPRKLQYLLIDHCNIRELPAELPVLQILHCRGCEGLTALPAKMPMLQDLDCSYCTRLATLPTEMPQLQRLYCRDCKALAALPTKMPMLQVLDCSYSTGLAALPTEMPQLEWLQCRDCKALTALQTKVPMLQDLDCSYSTGLAALPTEMPKLKWLHCRGCEALSILPAVLPSCKIIDLSYSPQLAKLMLPELPGKARVYSELLELDFSSLDIPILTLMETPLYFLLKLGLDYLLQGRPFPNISYVEANGAYSKAINVGGIRRDFVRTLLQNLFTDTEHCEKLRRNNGIPMVVGLENEEVAYRSLGRILALCYQGTAARFESGPLFSSNFYRALAFYPCSTQIALALLDLPADVEDIVNGKDTASDEAYSRAYQVLFNCEASDQEHRAYFAEKQHQKELDEQLMLSLSDPSIQVYCQALQWIAEEMEQGLGETEWTALQARPCEEIQTCIEGSLV